MWASVGYLAVAKFVAETNRLLQADITQLKHNSINQCKNLQNLYIFVNEEVGNIVLHYKSEITGMNEIKEDTFNTGQINELFQKQMTIKSSEKVMVTGGKEGRMLCVRENFDT